MISRADVVALSTIAFLPIPRIYMVPAWPCQLPMHYCCVFFPVAAGGYAAYIHIYAPYNPSAFVIKRNFLNTAFPNGGLVILTSNLVLYGECLYFQFALEKTVGISSGREVIWFFLSFYLDEAWVCYFIVLLADGVGGTCILQCVSGIPSFAQLSHSQIVQMVFPIGWGENHGPTRKELCMMRESRGTCSRFKICLLWFMPPSCSASSQSRFVIHFIQIAPNY